MNPNTLPCHARTGLTALGWRNARPGEDGPQPIWPILGGAEDEDTDKEETDDSEEEKDDSAADEETKDEQLGEAGTKALAAEKARRKTEADRRRTAEARVAELEAQAAKGQDGEPTADQIRAEATSAATAKANARIVRSEIRAAAAGKLADPKDALTFIDLSKFEVDEDGQVDEAEIADAIEDLLKTKPYLAAQSRQRFQGAGDQGARNGSGAPAQVTEAELNKMTPDQVDKARREGRLNDLLGVKR